MSVHGVNEIHVSTSGDNYRCFSTRWQREILSFLASAERPVGDIVASLSCRSLRCRSICGSCGTLGWYGCAQGGPFKPDFGLSGEVPLDKVLPLLVRVFVPSIPTLTQLAL